MAAMARAEFFGMAGLTEARGLAPYTPVSLGKGNKIRDGNASWIANLRNIDFRNATELRQQAPEAVTPTDVYVNGQQQPKFKAIVGDNTRQVYSIKSDRYIPLQNQALVEALADVSEITGIPVFGRLDDERGRMGINAFFADPNCNVDFAKPGHQADPYMLGVRVYNSHTGETGFGATIIGVRYLCSNMCSFGATLGQVHWKHLVEQDKVVGQITNMVQEYMRRVPALQRRIERMHEEVLTLDMADCALWGIKASPFQVDGIMDNLHALNPEADPAIGAITTYDLFNAVTAYNTHANTGGREYSRSDMSRRAEGLITMDIDDLVQKGREARDKYLELKINANNTVLVSD